MHPVSQQAPHRCCLCILLLPLPLQHFSEIVGTPFYMAPEVLERCYGPAADIWSVGVVVFLMLAGRLPFDGATDRGIIKAVLDSEPDFLHPAWDGISAAAKDCVSRMLVKDPRQRASVQQLLAHPWLAGRMRSSCCSSNAGDTAVAPASSCDASAAAAQGSRCAASIPHHLQQQGGVACSSSSHPCVDTSSSSSHGSSKAVGVTWASDVTAGSTPRGRRDSSPTPRKPVLSPIKSMRSRAGDF
jgi:serine/threonine protein kinase